MLDANDHRDFILLKADDPVAFRADACLIVRRPGAECGLCRDACPKSVLGGGEWSVALETDGCIGCGLCAAACPTGAIAVDGFPRVESGAGRAGARAIECARVPAASRRDGAEVVPCLGGLTVPDLIERAAAGGAVIVDRGLCGDCGVGCGAAPWAEALEQARAQLARVDGACADRLGCETEPLDRATARPAAEALRPDLHKNARPNRRDLLRRVLEPVPDETPLERSRRIIEGRGLVSAVRRDRELAGIAALAAQTGREMPAALYPAIRLAEGCGLHGVCAAICPTGALSLDHGLGDMTLSFDAAACINCAECQRACPTKALSLWPEGDGSRPEGRQVLAVRASRSCDGCGATFPLAPGDTTRSYCPICEKSIGLMTAFFAPRQGCPSPEPTDR